MTQPTRVIPTSNGDIRIPLDPHTWLYDVRDMIRMLNGEIDLPHLIYNTLGTDRYIKNCDICDDAFDKRMLYKEQKKQLDISIKP